MRNFSVQTSGLILMLCAFCFAQERPQPRLSVPDINGLAITLVKPAFPETAVAAGADGEVVTLRVVVDENGNVISATCSLTCHAMLKDAAELAALQSKFKPHIRDGKAVQYEGSLMYTFVVNRVKWFAFGTALESVMQFDNISAGPVAQMLPTEYESEKKRLLALDDAGVTLETRWKTIGEVVTSLKTKLKGADLWRFELSIALRRITIWTQAGEKTDRAAMQRAIDELAPFITSAPEDIPEQAKTRLTAISKYRVPEDLAERDLRKAISDMTIPIRRFFQ